MKMLLSSTALVLVLGLPTLTMAQTTAPAANPNTQQQRAEMPGFLTARAQSDLFASELMGHDVHARRTPSDTTSPGAMAERNSDGTAAMATISPAELDDMDMIGQVTEIVLSSDGQVRALVIGIGGFLGMGERDVAVAMDQVRFATDVDDHSQFHIVLNTGADMLRDSPEYGRTVAQPRAAADGTTADRAMADDTAANRAAADSDQARVNQAAFTAPMLEREGYTRVLVTDVSSDTLSGKTVYDVNDNTIGTVDDLIIDDSGMITDVIIDFGGFLGFGTSQVRVDFDELTILSNAGSADVRIYIDASKEQIQAQPQYLGLN